MINDFALIVEAQAGCTRISELDSLDGQTHLPFHEARR